MSPKDDLQKQIAAHNRRLQILRDWQIRQGIETPPSVISEIVDIEEELKRLQAELAQLGEPQVVPISDLPSKERQYQIALHWDEDGRKTNLRRFDLSGRDLRLVVLSGANLSLAELSGADLYRANLQNADLQLATLRETRLEKTCLSGVDLSGANLRGVKIDGTTRLDEKWRLVWEIVNRGAKGRDLREADLNGANLSRTDLRGINFKGSDLSEADLSGADLKGCDLYRADLKGAQYTSTTKWPAGVDPEKRGAVWKPE
jgi:hypothetical protein